MPKFPVDAPKRRVVKALESLGFCMVQEREHIAMIRENPDGSKTPLNHAESFHPQKLYSSYYLHASQHSPLRFFAGV